MSNSTHHATTDYEFLVAIMKQNPLSMIAVAFFALCIVTFWLLEIISDFEVDQVIIAVIQKIRVVLHSLRQQSSRINFCIACGLSLCLWVLERCCKLLVGICTSIHFVFSSLGIFLDEAFVVLVNICNFPSDWTFLIAGEMLALIKMILNGLFEVVKLFLFSVPIALVKWHLLFSVSLSVKTLCVVMTEFSEQSKMLTRAFESAETYMRTQFFTGKIKQFRELLTCCQTLVNKFLLSIFVVMCWWSFGLVHSAIFWTTGCNIAFHVTGHVGHADMSLHTMIRCLLIVGEFLVKHLIKYLAPTMTNMFAYLKISFEGLFQSVESMTLKAIAPLLSSHDGNALEVGRDVGYGDFSTYGIVCYLLGLVKYIVV